MRFLMEGIAALGMLAMGVACGSETDDGVGAGGGNGGTGGAGGVYEAPVDCAGQSCPSSEVCCAPAGTTPAAACVPEAECQQLVVKCDGPEDCPGEVCCGDILSGFDCKADADCLEPGVECNESSDCPEGVCYFDTIQHYTSSCQQIAGYPVCSVEADCAGAPNACCCPTFGGLLTVCMPCPCPT